MDIVKGIPGYNEKYLASEAKAFYSTTSSYFGLMNTRLYVEKSCEEHFMCIANVDKRFMKTYLNEKKDEY